MTKGDFEFYSVWDVMELTGLHQRRTVYSWIKSGKLEAFKCGKEWRITREAMDKFIAENTGRMRPDAHPRTKTAEDTANGH